MKYCHQCKIIVFFTKAHYLTMISVINMLLNDNNSNEIYLQIDF